MNIFDFLDNVVKGIIGFALNLFYTTGLMLVKPLRGPSKLYRDHRSEDKSQISSLSYLTFALLTAAAVLFTVADFNEESNSNLGALGAGFLISGTMPDNFGAWAASAFITVIMLAALLRLLVWLAGLKGRKRERFLVTSEYLLGLTVFVPLIVGLPVLLAIEVEVDEPVAIALGGAIILVILWTIYVVGFNLVGSLTRSPGLIGATRAILRLGKTSRRLGITATEAFQQAIIRWTKVWRRAPGGKISIDWRNYALAILVYIALFVPASAAAAALLGTVWLSNWLVSQQEPSATLEVMRLRCNFAAQPPTASATLWNRSSEPVADWRELVKVRLVSGGSWEETKLDWRGPSSMDLLPPVLAPGAVADVSGPLVVDENARKILATGGDVACRVDVSAEVHVSGNFEPNVVRPPNR